MDQEYDITPEKLEAIRGRAEVMMLLLAREMDSHPQIIGLGMMMVLGNRYGRGALDALITSARDMRQMLVSVEKADARAARQARAEAIGPARK
jgi:hypothetical protein